VKGVIEVKERGISVILWYLY